MRSPIVPPETLAGWIAAGRTDLRVVDVRWYLGQPRGTGRAAYEAGHIPGAIHLDLDTDLVAPEGPGRHPLPSPDTFVRTLAANGIGDDDVVVAYDDVGGCVAARLWWMLDDLGFGANGRGGALVLDGGLPAWTAAGGSLTRDTPSPRITGMYLASEWRRVIDREALKRDLGRVLLLDARGAPRYRGEIEPIDPKPGHIPTSLSAPTDGNLGPDGRFRSPNELAARFEVLRAAARTAGMPLAADSAARLVTSCGSGVSACHNALAMRIAGLADPILYPGSYSDWSSAGEPVATGPEPGRPPTTEPERPPSV
jgi:thiosulfate/3-mercaptopyruvate sulfurtransferase